MTGTSSACRLAVHCRNRAKQKSKEVGADRALFFVFKARQTEATWFYVCAQNHAAQRELVFSAFCFFISDLRPCVRNSKNLGIFANDATASLLSRPDLCHCIFHQVRRFRCRVTVLQMSKLKQIPRSRLSILDSPSLNGDKSCVAVTDQGLACQPNTSRFAL